MSSHFAATTSLLFLQAQWNVPQHSVIPVPGLMSTGPSLQVEEHSPAVGANASGPPPLLWMAAEYRPNWADDPRDSRVRHGGNGHL